MFTDRDFRRLALGMKDVVEGAHMGHPDFRASGRIFATLNADGKIGTVALTPEQQREFIERQGAAFRPAAGAWGRQGATLVTLAEVDEETTGEAMTLAWQNAAARTAQRSKGRTRPASRRMPGRKR